MIITAVLFKTHTLLASKPLKSARLTFELFFFFIVHYSEVLLITQTYFSNSATLGNQEHNKALGFYANMAYLKMILFLAQIQ